jgi:hypothetical protein
MPTFDTPKPISATIDLAIGDVRISAGERRATDVDVQPSDASNPEDVKAAEQTRVELANEQLVVKVPKLRPWVSRTGGGSVAVSIRLPAGSHVRGSAGSADFHGDGRLGDCSIKTGLGSIQLAEAARLRLTIGIGDISVGHVTGDADVTAGSGDVRLRELDRDAVVKNSNGDTWVGEARGDLRVKAANGSVGVDVARASVGARSANGDVRVGEAAGGPVALETHRGDLEIGIREGTAAWLDLRSTAGKVRNALEASGAPEPADETVEVRARTTVGDIVVRRP